MKTSHDNTGKFGRVRPLTRMQRLPFRDLAATSRAELEGHQARRVWADLRAFIPIRYPEGRNIVLATVFLTLGAQYAKRAGVDAGEVVRFVSQEQEKCA